jgi:hypothetical protein
MTCIATDDRTGSDTATFSPANDARGCDPLAHSAKANKTAHERWNTYGQQQSRSAPPEGCASPTNKQAR